jgi:hypothetical protein
MSEFATPALEAANLGFAAFPCKPGGKTPAIAGWQRKATTDPNEILALAERYPRANVGIAASDWFALDVDGDDGERTLEGLGLDLPPTLESSTRNGRHLIFKATLPFRPRARLGKGLDVKGNYRGKPTGYLIAPTSIVKGHEYGWLNDLDPAPAPDALIERLAARKEPSTWRVGSPIYRGARNSTLTRIAGALRRDGFNTPTALTAALTAANMERCRPPLPHEEVAKIAKSASRWEQSPLWISEPLEFARDKRLHAPARAVLIALCSHAKIDNRARPGIRRLSELTGLAPDTITRATHELEEARRIRVSRSRKGNRYLILPYRPVLDQGQSPKERQM